MSPQESIKQLEERLKEIDSRPFETYSRVVGYYRPTQQWNNGKLEEYKVRKPFNKALKEDL